MDYFDLLNTNEIVSLDDSTIQKELEKMSYEKYLRDKSIERNSCKKTKKKKNKKKSGVKTE